MIGMMHLRRSSKDYMVDVGLRPCSGPIGYQAIIKIMRMDDYGTLFESEPGEHDYAEYDSCAPWLPISR